MYWMMKKEIKPFINISQKEQKIMYIGTIKENTEFQFAKLYVKESKVRLAS